jgi:hypothetical protein
MSCKLDAGSSNSYSFSLLDRMPIQLQFALGNTVICSKLNLLEMIVFCYHREEIWHILATKSQNRKGCERGYLSKNQTNVPNSIQVLTSYIDFSFNISQLNL